MKRDLSSPFRLVLRTYACPIGDALFARRLRRVLTKCPAFNGCFLLQDYPRLARIGGMDQHGDIVVRYAYNKEGWTVTVEHRAGDEGLVEVLEREMANELRPCPTPPSPLKTRPPGMAYFFQMVQGQPLGRKVQIAEAVIEQALTLKFADYQGTRRQLEFLSRLHLLRATYKTGSADTRDRYLEAMERHERARFCLHAGQKVRLDHQLRVYSPSKIQTLRLHFALLPTGGVLVGGVTEQGG